MHGIHGRWRYFPLALLRYSPLALMLAHGPLTAREFFNPHALEIDNPGQPLADLSAFAEAGGQAPGVYRVTVSVNGEAQGAAQDIAFVAGTGGKLIAQLTPGLLKQWGVKTHAFPTLAALPAERPLDDIGRYIPQASATLRFSTLQLEVSIPQAAMERQARGRVDPAEWDPGLPAALLGYSLSGSHARRDRQGTEENYYANLQSGVNLGAWRLRNYSTWSYDGEKGGRWQTVSSWLQRDIHALKGQLTLGDSATLAEVFDSVALRGAQLAADDNMLPDSQRGFAPVIRGIAGSNAQVTVKQNDYIIYQTYVAPGAFVINDLYPTAASGDMTVTIREADGRERTFVQPYAAVPLMQREGRLKYAVAAGRYRSTAPGGREPFFGQLTALYGLPRGITAYGGLLYAPVYQSGVTGLGVGLGTLGSLSADITAAHATLNNNDTRNGQSYRVQYSKDIRATATYVTLAAYRYSTGGFYTFQEANDISARGIPGRVNSNKRQRLQLDITQSVGGVGSFFISGYQQDYWRTRGFERTLSTGWNGTVNGISYGLVYSYSDYPDSSRPADQRLAFNLQVPLSRFLPASLRGRNNAWASYAVNAARRGDTRQQAGLNGTLLADNNLSYSVQQSYVNHGGGGAGSLSLDYRGGYGQLTGGYNYDAHTQQVNYGLKGGIVAHPYGVTLSQSPGQSLALVKAPGAGGVKVQNQTGVYTDARGYAVVPYVNPYKHNRIALEPGTLADGVDVEGVVTRVTPTQGALVLAEFHTRIGRRMLMSLTYRGLPVPFGARAELKSGGEGIVGDNGQVYLTGAPEEGELAVSWSGAQRCHVRYRLPQTAAATSSPVITTTEECR